MKKYVVFIVVVVSALLVTSCNTGPKPIDYGNDGCHYCKMTIVDKIHGAELVTEKGKVFKFDATECMLNYQKDNPAIEHGNFYTNYYENPSALINSAEATFLISEKLPSPMNGNITAFKDKNEAQKVQAEIDGTRYTWDALKNHLNK